MWICMERSLSNVRFRCVSIKYAEKVSQCNQTRANDIVAGKLKSSHLWICSGQGVVLAIRVMTARLYKVLRRGISDILFDRLAMDGPVALWRFCSLRLNGTLNACENSSLVTNFYHIGITCTPKIVLYSIFLEYDLQLIIMFAPHW